MIACLTLLAIRQPGLILVILATFVTVGGQDGDGLQIYFCFLMDRMVGTPAILRARTITFFFRKPFLSITRPQTGQ